MTAAWAALLGQGLVLEAWALRDKRAGDTLSEHVWLLRTRGAGRLIVYPAWSWLTWHFFGETERSRARLGVSDAAAVLVGVAVAVWRSVPVPR